VPDTIKEDLKAQIEKLPAELQSRLLEFIKTLVPRGIEGKNLLRFEGAIPPRELELMSRAIEEGCEKIDLGEW